MPFFIGLDLGQNQDYTAIGIIETTDTYVGMNFQTYERKYTGAISVRYLERVRLGTSYLAVAERVRQVANSPRARRSLHPRDGCHRSRRPRP